MCIRITYSIIYPLYYSPRHLILLPLCHKFRKTTPGELAPGVRLEHNKCVCASIHLVCWLSLPCVRNMSSSLFFFFVHHLYVVYVVVEEVTKHKQYTENWTKGLDGCGVIYENIGSFFTDMLHQHFRCAGDNESLITRGFWAQRSAWR